MIESENFLQFKTKPLVVITAYDACFSKIAEQAKVDAILVGDSLANVVLGLKRTQAVNIEVMKLFVEAVARGVENTHVIGDMPFGSYENERDAIENGNIFISAGAHSVKIEGPKPKIVSAMIKEGIPVMGHMGLLPQTAESFKQVGQSSEEKELITNQALELESAGIYSLVLEHIPAEFGKSLTKILSIPTVGIGAGPHTDGQVLVLHDVLGMYSRKNPPFAPQFADLYQSGLKGIQDFAEAVRTGNFSNT